MIQLDDDKKSFVCPWCQREDIRFHIVSGTLRLNCPYCRLDAFITRLPVGTSLKDFESRKTIS